jgi:hypothetical protein
MKLKLPAASVVAVWAAAVALLTSCTAALGTPAPDGSCTLPCTLLVNCANAAVAKNTVANSTNKRRGILPDIGFLPRLASTEKRIRRKRLLKRPSIYRLPAATVKYFFWDHPFSESAEPTPQLLEKRRRTKSQFPGSLLDSLAESLFSSAQDRLQPLLLTIPDPSRIVTSCLVGRFLYCSCKPLGQ